MSRKIVVSRDHEQIISEYTKKDVVSIREAIIEICQKKIGHGWAKRHISYTPTLINMGTGVSMEKEDLGIKVYTNPENQAQLKYNKARYLKAYALLNQRQSGLNEGHIRLRSTDFISFYLHLAATKSYNLTASETTDQVYRRQMPIQ